MIRRVLSLFVVIASFAGVCITGNCGAEAILESAAVHYLRGVLFIHGNEFERALEELNKAQKHDSDSGYLKIKTGFVLLRLGREKEAEEEFKRAKTLEEDNLDASIALVFLYAGRGDQQSLEKEYKYFLERAHQLKPDNILISEYLGRFYFYKKMPKEAIKVYKTIIEQKPDYSGGYFWLGYLYEENGQRDEAIDMWEKALELNPNHADTLNSLGYTYAEEGINLDEAEKMLNRALEQEHDNGAYLDSLGWVYFKKGDYSRAEVFLLKAAAFLKDPEIYEHLGDLYIKTGRKKEALEFYKKGLYLDKDNARLKEKIKLYEDEDTQAAQESQ